MRKETNKPVGNRQLRVGELIRHAISEIFSKGKIIDPLLADIPITVSEVRVTSDLKFAKVFVISYSDKLDKANFIKSLKANTPAIRMMLNKKVKLKYSPDLDFVIDDSFDNGIKIENLLKTI